MLLVFFCFSGSLQAAKPELLFVAMELPVYMEAEGRGPLYEVHAQIVEQVEKALGVSISTQIVPPVRADQVYRSGKAAAFVPDFCDVPAPIASVRSIPLARVQRHLFTAPNAASFSRLDQLKGKKVGLVRGYMYQLPEQTDFEKVMIISQRNALRMLISGRLDAILANPVEIAEISRDEALPMPNYQPEQPLVDKALCYTFPDDELGRHLAIATSAAILSLRDNGQLVHLLGASHIGQLEMLESTPLPTEAPLP